MKSNEMPGGSSNLGLSFKSVRANTTIATSMKSPLSGMDESATPSSLSHDLAASTSALAFCEMEHVVRPGRRRAWPLVASVPVRLGPPQEWRRAGRFVNLDVEGMDESL